METLLVATDFSKASRNATLYGVKLAEAMGAKVVLLNVYPFVIPTSDTVPMITDQDLENSSQSLLLDEINALALKDTVTIEMHSEQGRASDVILSFAQEVEASWIIAGMKGYSKIERTIFGGTALSLSRHSTIPVILVPEKAGFQPPKVIALASDITDKTDISILDPLKEFGEKFYATMYVVRVVKKGISDVFERLLSPSRLKWHLKELHPCYEFLNDQSVAHAMTNFAKDHAVDLVVMISEEHNLIERIFIKSNIKEMIISTSIPLLVLPGKISRSVSETVNENQVKHPQLL
jgi:nucleotide-binding universal stress UspA family protein